MHACAGMCRAHGIAHQKVTERGDLRKALQAAWALNKHSVVEVITNRNSNVTHHRAIQERVRQAVLRALRTVSMPAGAAMCHTCCSVARKPTVSLCPFVQVLQRVTFLERLSFLNRDCDVSLICSVCS